MGRKKKPKENPTTTTAQFDETKISELLSFVMQRPEALDNLIGSNDLEAIGKVMQLYDFERHKIRSALTRLVVEDKNNEIINIILSNSKISAQYLETLSQEAKECNALHLASKHKAWKNVETLLTHGFDPNAKGPFGNTPLHCAVLPKPEEKIITKGNVVTKSYKNIECSDKNNTAKFQNCVAIIKTLLAEGADASIENNDKLIPLELAYEGKCQAAIKCKQFNIFDFDIDANAPQRYREFWNKYENDNFQIEITSYGTDSAFKQLIPALIHKDYIRLDELKDQIIEKIKAINNEPLVALAKAQNVDNSEHSTEFTKHLRQALDTIKTSGTLRSLLVEISSLYKEPDEELNKFLQTDQCLPKWLPLAMLCNETALKYGKLNNTETALSAIEVAYKILQDHPNAFKTQVGLEVELEIVRNMELLRLSDPSEAPKNIQLLLDESKVQTLLLHLLTFPNILGNLISLNKIELIEKIVGQLPVSDLTLQALLGSLAEFVIDDKYNEALSIIFTEHKLSPVNFQETPGGGRVINALHLASAFNAGKNVKLLVDSGLDPNAQCPLGNTAAHYALSPKPEAVKVVTDGRTYIHYNNITPTDESTCQKGHEVLQLLLAKGVKLDILNDCALRAEDLASSGGSHDTISAHRQEYWEKRQEVPLIIKIPDNAFSVNLKRLISILISKEYGLLENLTDTMIQDLKQESINAMPKEKSSLAQLLVEINLLYKEPNAELNKRIIETLQSDPPLFAQFYSYIVHDTSQPEAQPDPQHGLIGDTLVTA
jgi:Ankyrin repeats (many copies)/Ankyrin repeat